MVERCQNGNNGSAEKLGNFSPLLFADGECSKVEEMSFHIYPKFECFAGVFIAQGLLASSFAFSAILCRASDWKSLANKEKETQKISPPLTSIIFFICFFSSFFMNNIPVCMRLSAVHSATTFLSNSLLNSHQHKNEFFMWIWANLCLEKLLQWMIITQIYKSQSEERQTSS